MNDEIETDETSELDFIRHLLPDNKAAYADFFKNRCVPKQRAAASCEWGHPINLYDFKTSGKGLPCFNDEENEMMKRDRTDEPIQAAEEIDLIRFNMAVINTHIIKKSHLLLNRKQMAKKT